MTVRKFFAIAFMCHQRPDRSFCINGKQFPLCARCTGILAGYFLGITAACLTRCRYCAVCMLLLIPMIVDGMVQQILKIESNNVRRFITGILGGIGIIYTLISLHCFTVWWVRAFLEYFTTFV